MQRIYKCLKKQIFADNNYLIKPVSDDDILNIMKWRNEQIDVLRQAKILTEKEQTDYYEKIIWPSMKELKPEQILFSYFFEDILIGYGGLVHISWIDKRAEVSFLLSTERTKDEINYCNEFFNFLELIKKVAFTGMGFNRICGETYDIRPVHIKTLEKAGFVLEGRLKQHVYINGCFVDSLIHGFLFEMFNDFSEKS